MSALPFKRGDALLAERHLERFPFLIDKKGTDEPRNWMLKDSDKFRWAPKDCVKASSCIEDFSAAGYGFLHVVLSIVGYGATQYNNSFAKAGYSYIHMPFAQLKGFLQVLHPDDRYIAYVMTEAAAPIHMYFDIDADFEKLPHLKDHEEECIKLFWALLDSFFKKLFGRKLNPSGLLLLQASNAKKMSWHLHLHSEAFKNMEQLRDFVKHFREFIQRNKDKESLKKLPLCVPNPKKADTFIHVVDFAPYMRNQNLRAPYNQKPGKMPLRVRKHAFEANGALTVLAKDQVAIEDEVIDAAVLFHAHPSLAQPSEPGYVHLTMESSSIADMFTGDKKEKKKRKSEHTDEQEEEDDDEKTLKPKRSKEGRESLTTEEIKAVKRIVSLHLGRAVQFHEVYRCAEEIRGSCVQGTADCHCLRERTKKTDAKHSSNRMSFCLSRGQQLYHCFDDDCNKKDKVVSLINDDHTERLLMGEAAMQRREEFTTALIQHTTTQPMNYNTQLASIFGIIKTPSPPRPAAAAAVSSSSAAAAAAAPAAGPPAPKPKKLSWW